MNELTIDKIISDINSLTKGACQLVEYINDELVIEIPSSQLCKTIEFLVQGHESIHLSTITIDIDNSAPDYIHALYHFWENISCSLLVKLDTKNPELDSIISLIPGADFYEREAAEMYGIRFANRESTPALLLPDDYKGAPPMLIKKEK